MAKTSPSAATSVDGTHTAQDLARRYLAAEGFGDDNADRLCTAFHRLQTFSVVALRANLLVGVLLATFNGWHVFVGHLVVASTAAEKASASS